jgi:large subunit ribosomal protein L11
MGKVTVDALVDGGKATAGPPIGNQLGPLKVNTMQIAFLWAPRPSQPSS